VVGRRRWRHTWWGGYWHLLPQKEGREHAVLVNGAFRRATNATLWTRIREQFGRWERNQMLARVRVLYRAKLRIEVGDGKPVGREDVYAVRIYIAPKLQIHIP